MASAVGFAGSITESFIPEEAFVLSNAEAAAKLMEGYSVDEIASLLNVNRGETPESKMITHGLTQAVKNREIYVLHGSGRFHPVRAAALDVVDLEVRASRPLRVEVPPHVEVEAVWDTTPFVSGEGNNILGDNGRLIMDLKSLSVPSVEATDVMLAYYGATLIEEGEIVRFPDDSFPLFLMSVGERYVPDTLMTEKMGGFYLEYHTDRPHLHYSMKSRGNYLLARWNEDKTKLQVTGFRIPDGKAVYSKRGAIHCDAALIGDLIVGYSTANECSTVLITNNKNERVPIDFVEEIAPRAAGALASGMKV